MDAQVLSFFAIEMAKSAASMDELAEAAGAILRGRKNLVRLRQADTPGMAVRSPTSSMKRDLLNKISLTQHLDPEFVPGPGWSLKNERMRKVLRDDLAPPESVPDWLRPGREDLSYIISSKKGGFVGANNRRAKKQGRKLSRRNKSQERAAVQKGMNSFANIHEANELLRADKQNQIKDFAGRRRLNRTARAEGHQDILVPLLDHNMAVAATGKGSDKFRSIVRNMRRRESDKYNKIVRPILGQDDWTYGVSPKLNRHARKKIERALIQGKLEDGRRFQSVDDLMKGNFLPPVP